MRDAMNKLGSDSNKINPLVRDVLIPLEINGCLEISVNLNWKIICFVKLKFVFVI